jgi:hypothetical protein
VNIDDITLGQRVVWTDPDAKRHLGTLERVDADSAYAKDTNRHAVVLFDEPRFDGDPAFAAFVLPVHCHTKDLDAIPPEPPDGAVVLTSSGQAWQRDDDLPAGKGQHWWGAGEYDYSNETWEGLIRLHGLPVRVIYTPEEES